MQFSEILRELRIDKHLTQKQLGQMLGVTDSAVRLWETQGREPEYIMLCKIADIFSVTVGQLLGVEKLP